MLKGDSRNTVRAILSEFLNLLFKSQVPTLFFKFKNLNSKFWVRAAEEKKSFKLEITQQIFGFRIEHTGHS